MRVNNIPPMHTFDFEQRKVECMDKDGRNLGNTRKTAILLLMIAENCYLIILAKNELRMVQTEKRVNEAHISPL